MASASHIGASSKRKLLEDRSRVEEIRTGSGQPVQLGVVADGIGGENAGERAAELTVTTVFEFCQHSEEQNIPQLLQSALEEANQKVYAEARKSRRKTNMGSTAAVAAIADGRLYIANVGDSRIYLLRGRKAFPLTIDHTWENEIVASGRLSRAEAARHPRRDQIVRSIGYEARVDVDLGLWLRGGQESAAEARGAQGLPLKRGDAVLICSDGLIKTRHNRSVAHYVEAGELAPLVLGRPAKRAVDGLIRRALQRQVDDNVSAVVLQVPGGLHVRRYLAPAAALAAALVLVGAAAAWGLPRLGSGPAVLPTIPALPSGVAFVSDWGGRAESSVDGEAYQPLETEQLITAGEGVLLRSLGAQSYLRLGLADQSLLYLGPDSELELLEIGGPAGSRLRLHSGRLVLSRPVPGEPGVSVLAPSGVRAVLTGTLMGAIWDPISGVFWIACFAQPCRVAAPGGESTDLTSGQQISIDYAGNIDGPTAIAHEHYAFADYAGGLVATPTAIGGDAGGTTTAATRTPFGPLFVSPTPPPPPPTNTPAPPTRRPPGPTSPPASSDTPSPTETALPTDTPLPSETPLPSDTPMPSDTPTPAPTDTPTKTPGPPPTRTDTPPPTATNGT